MITFWIPGSPVGQPRQRVGIMHGHARTYTPKTLKRADGSKRANPIFAWKDAIRAAAGAHVPAATLEGPLDVSIKFYFPRPAAHFRAEKAAKKNGVLLHAWAPYFCTSKPDRDNCDKAVLDVLTEMKFWNDDAQVCDGRIEKLYGAPQNLHGLTCGALVMIQAAGKECAPWD